MHSRIIWVALSMAPLTSWSQAEPAQTVIPNIIVTADPFAERSPVEATQPTDVLSGEDLQRARGSTLGETLANQPGVHGADFSAGASRPVIRGLGGPRVRILDGGSGVIDASTISPDHAVSAEAFRARQIEILKGPATLLYGSGAIGGVVNVVSDLVPTQPSEEWHGSLGFSGSSVDDGRTSFGHLGGGNGQLAFHLDALTRDTGDYDIPGFADSDGAQEADAVRGHVPNSATATDSFGLGAAWTGERGYLGLGWSAYDSGYGVPGHGHEEAHTEETPAEEHAQDEAGVRIALDQRRVELRGGYRPQGGFLERIRGSLVLSEYEHVEIEPEEAHAEAEGEHAGEEEEAHHTVFRNEGQEARLELTHRPLAGWRGVFGLQGLAKEFSASGEEAFVPPVDSEGLGFFLVEERAIGQHRLSLGSRLERLSHDPQAGTARNYNLFNLSAGLHLELSAAQHLNINLSRAQRAPDVQELYSNGPHLATNTFERGNATLQEETALNLDLGWTGQFGPLTLSVDGFYTRYRDFIFPSEVDEDGDGQPDFVHAEENPPPGEEGELLLLDFTQADADFWGGEAQARLLLDRRHSLSLAGDVVRAQRADGSALPRMPAARLSLGLDGETGAWTWGTRLMRVLRQDRTALLESETAGYTLLSADLAYRIPTRAGDVHIALRGRNLLDEEARNHVSFLKDLAPLPGAKLQLDLGFEF